MDAVTGNLPAIELFRQRNARTSYQTDDRLREDSRQRATATWFPNHLAASDGRAFRRLPSYMQTDFSD